MIPTFKRLDGLPTNEASFQLQKTQTILSIVLLALLTYTAFIQKNK